MDRDEDQQVGGQTVPEYRVPVDDLAGLSANLAGDIDVLLTAACRMLRADSGMRGRCARQTPIRKSLSSDGKSDGYRHARDAEEDQDGEAPDGLAAGVELAVCER